MRWYISYAKLFVLVPLDFPQHTLKHQFIGYNVTLNFSTVFSSKNKKIKWNCKKTLQQKNYIEKNLFVAHTKHIVAEYSFFLATPIKYESVMANIVIKTWYFQVSRIHIAARDEKALSIGSSWKSIWWHNIFVFFFFCLFVSVCKCYSKWPWSMLHSNK